MSWIQSLETLTAGLQPTGYCKLNVAKTEFMVIGSSQRIHALSNNQFNIEIDGQINQKSWWSQITGLVNRRTPFMDKTYKRKK